MDTPTTRYTSYLLRIWRSEAGDPPAWRAFLRDLTTGRSLGFASLESLIEFLESTSTASSPVQLATGDEEQGDRPS